MADKVRCEVFIVIDEDGDYSVGADAGEAQELHDNNTGGNGPRRVIKRTFLIRPPQVEDTGESDIADTDNGAVEVAEEVAASQPV